MKEELQAEFAVERELLQKQLQAAQQELARAAEESEAQLEALKQEYTQSLAGGPSSDDIVKVK